MAQRGSVTYLGSLHDPGFGVDDVGVLFCTQQDAVAALTAWHRQGDGWKGFPVLRPTGEYGIFVPPVLSDEAFIMLWHLDAGDQIYEPLVSKIVEEWGALDTHDYMAERATHAVWVGARQAIRHGSFAEYEEQAAVRKRQEVREAGSVVVTDA